ncbi:hypothetical protein [Nocardia concava]|uniref:hypothetical protein n=1 Tax=Nocardia concava TaxID=257281 RepID=UPI0002FED5D1|nr:hypothetical protein [Nocardia concava]
MTTELATPAPPITAPLPALLRGGPAPALIRGLAGAAERGTLQKTIYAIGWVVAFTVVSVAFTIYFTILPDGSSSTEIAHFFHQYNPYIKALAGIAGFGYPLLIWISGSIGALLYQADTSPGKRVSWMALISDVLLFAAFAIETGLFAVTALLVDHVSAEIIHTLHVAAFASAYMLGGIWVPFLVGFIVISVRTKLFPTWINWTAALCLVTNTSAGLGFLTLTGPLNSMNGVIGLGGATVGPVIFLVMITAWLIVQDAPAALIRLRNRI